MLEQHPGCPLIDDGERLVRVFADALETDGGSTSFRGMTFSGVAVEVDDAGRCELTRYTGGLATGTYVEPLVEPKGSLMIFDDEGEEILAEHAQFGVQFEGQPFSGFSIERSSEDPDFVGVLTRFVEGSPGSGQIEWYPDGQMAQFYENKVHDGLGRVSQRYSWHRDGSLALSQFMVHVVGEPIERICEVEVDEAGLLTAVTIYDWNSDDELLPAVQALAKDRVLWAFADLAGRRVGRRLRLGFRNNYAELGLNILLADGGMDELEEMSGWLSGAAVERLVRLPRLRRVEFTAPPDERGRELLLEWQSAKSEREAVLP